jgi:hypothetical protein
VGDQFRNWSTQAIAIDPTLEVEEALRDIHRNIALLQKSSQCKDLASQFYNLISTLLIGRCLRGVQRYCLRGFNEDGSPASPDDYLYLMAQRKTLATHDDKPSCRRAFLTVKVEWA